MKLIKYTLYFILIILVILGIIFANISIKRWLARNDSVSLSSFLFSKTVKFDEYKELKKIDKIFVINLDRSKSRFSRFSSELAKVDLGIPYERFSAADGRILEYTIKSSGKKFIHGDIAKDNIEFEDDVIVSCGNDIFIEMAKLSYISTFLQRFHGQVGAACSHRMIWKKMLDEGYEKVMIFEDDMGFAYNGKNIIENALRKTSGKADILYLRFTPWHIYSTDKSTADDGYLKITNDVASAEGYIINRKAAKIFYDNSYYYRDQIDGVMSNIIKIGLVKGYAVWPKVLTQGGGSDISSG